MRLSDERWTAAAILVCLYGVFIVWFCGFPMAPIALSEVDAEAYRDAFKGKIFEDEIAPHDFETFMSNDDGKPVMVTARLLFQDELKYPDNTPSNVTKADTVDAALSTLAWAVYSTAVPRGTVTLDAATDHISLFRSVEHARTDTEDEDNGDNEEQGTDSSSDTLLQKWSQQWTMRFRCRKDLLDTLLELEANGAWWHKLAAVRAVDVSVTSGTVYMHITPTAVVQLLVLLALIIVYELTEYCFPESPDMKELKKLRKRVKKLETKLDKTKELKEGDKTPSRSTSGAAEAADATPTH